jgi:hypothetical protein
MTRRRRGLSAVTGSLGVDRRAPMVHPSAGAALCVAAGGAGDGTHRWREVSFSAGFGVDGIATVLSLTSHPAARGVVLAHGGSDDGRRFFVAEAAALAAHGAAVILPVMRLRLEDGIDAFADDVRNAVLIERAALDVLVDWAGAPPGALSFLGHSGGGALGAILSAVEPRLSRIAIFGCGAGIQVPGVARPSP